MKALTCIVIYIASFIFLYMLLSVVGVVFTNNTYLSILRDGGWFGIYSLFIGSWLAALPTMEYAAQHEEYFRRVFH
jgi:hypothetical protein